MNNYHTYSTNKILEEFNTNIDGLKNNQIKENLKKFGKNELPPVKQKSLIEKFFSQFKDWMIIVLLASALISMFLSFFDNKGDLIDAIIIFAIVIFNAILGVVQEQKAENAMAELKKLSINETRVIREGKILNIKTNEVVVGDVILFKAGDIICADLFLIQANSLKINESTLTGESKPVNKKVVDNLPQNTSLGDRQNMAFSGTNVIYGNGKGVVVAVGKDTEIGKIAQMLTEHEQEQTILQKNLAQLGKVITVVVLLIASLIFFLDIIVSGKGLLDSIMTAIAIAVSAIPESLPAVVTIIMALGVVNMSKKNAIVKRLHSVETLGACEIICTDKTGTLTQNNMQVQKLWYDKNFINLNAPSKSASFEELLKCMVLCNDAQISTSISDGDPTEIALLDFALKEKIRKSELELNYKRISEIPFDSDRKMMSTINKSQEETIIYTKGAPDNLLKKCKKIFIENKIINLTHSHIKQIEDAVEQMGEDGLRVLAFGFKKENNNNQDIENELIFLGLVGMADPARPQAKSAVKLCHSAGMTPIMITGDHAETAFAIAKELGIAKKQSQVLLGSELDAMSDEEFAKRIKDIKVYARVSPQNKVRIVKTWKGLGKIVAMTGDGVNDAPSIKNAHIGIGMGITGTDVTKDVADIVLADDNFATIIYAVKEGRKIFDNIQKTIQFLFSTNITEVIALVLATIIFPQAIFLLPIQILFINLVTDSLPAIALGLEPSEKDIMKRKPRKIDDSVFSGGIGKRIIYQSIVQVVICISVFIYAIKNFDITTANTMAFITINLIQLFHMFNVHTHQSIFKSNPFKNKILILAFSAGFILTLCVALIPPLASAFKLASLSLNQWAVIIGSALLIIPIVEIVKFIDNHITNE